MITLAKADLGSVEDAVRYYATSGLQPVLIHAPIGTGGCTCGEVHPPSPLNPWGSTGKHPISRSWQKALSLDEIHNQLARLKFRPNVGIILGEQPAGGYVAAVDVDDEARFEALRRELGEVPRTARCDSGRGYRLLFEVPGQIATATLKNVTGLGGASGVDVKVKGGQIVVAPSLHPSGKTYAWSVVGEIAMLPMTWALAITPEKIPVPEWASTYTPQTMREDGRAKKRADKYLETAVLSEARALAGCGEGMRNTTLHRAAIKLFSLCAGLHLGGQWSWVYGQLKDAAKAAGLPEREIEKTLQGAETYVRETGAIRMPVGLHSPAASTVPARTAAPPEADDGTARKMSPEAFAKALEGVPVEEAKSGPSVMPGITDPLDRIQLVMDRGSPAKIAANVARLLSEHPTWRGGPMLDRYSQTIVWPTPLPKPIEEIHRNDRELVDADACAIQGWLMRMPESHRVRIGDKGTSTGAHLAAETHSIDLLHQWIDTFPEWDRVYRLDRWTTIYLGCEDTPYQRATGRAWLIAAMERATAPGSNVDIIPVLEGLTGKGKNFAIETLFAGGPSWAPWLQTISGASLDTPESARLACTRWILFDDELRAKDERRTDALKSWASRKTETYRLPYNREITTARRRANLLAATNLDHYLHDPTGNRRWWPWRIGDIDIPKLRTDRLQLLVEARDACRAGERWRQNIPDAMYAETLQESDNRRIRDPLYPMVEELIRTGKFQGRACAHFTTHEIGQCLGFSVEKIDRSFETRVGNVMQELRYRRVRISLPDGTRIRIYEPWPPYAQPRGGPGQPT